MEEHLGNSIYFQDLYYRNGRVLDKENGKTLIDDVKWVAKTHPCLVPYEDLPEEEREYDRNTSVGTLKLIMKLGFTIKKYKVSTNYISHF